MRCMRYGGNFIHRRGKAGRNMDAELHQKLKRLSALVKRLAQLTQRRARQRIEREIE
jgi:hypothetical protein